jgi:hypothetical protein
MLGAVVNLGSVLALHVWALRGFIRSGLPGNVPRDPFATEVGLALAATLFCCALTSVLPYQAAVRRLERMKR